jgi:hypothetical protein
MEQRQLEGSAHPKGKPREGEMQKFGFILIAVAILAFGALAGSRAEALGVAPAGIRAPIAASSPVAQAACREKRWGWHGWGWYPCKEQPVNTCEKCKWRWGYKYCWKVC